MHGNIANASYGLFLSAGAGWSSLSLSDETLFLPDLLGRHHFQHHQSSLCPVEREMVKPKSPFSAAVTLPAAPPHSTDNIHRQPARFPVHELIQQPELRFQPHRPWFPGPD